MSNREVLTFRLGSEEYGIDILSVQEIRSFETPTRIANAQQHVLGVLNLRGLIVPIVDLRVQLGLIGTASEALASVNDATVVVFANWEGQLLGMVVDGVNDVVQLGDAQIRPAPAMGMNEGAENLVAEVATIDERNLLLTDVGALMNARGQTALSATASDVAETLQ
jgi:purine-binding chemotaxis protein CheW